MFRNITWISEQPYSDIAHDLIDNDDDTCITRNQVLLGYVSWIGTLRIYNDDLTDSMIGNVTVAIKGQYSNTCDQIHFAYVAKNDTTPVCHTVRVCYPDEKRNDLISSGDICYVFL